MAFEALKIGDRIFETNYGETGLYAAFKKNWPANKLTQLWYYYEDGIKNGSIKPENPYKSTTNARYLERVTPYPFAHIIQWLNAMYDLVQSGKIDVEYWTAENISDSFIERAITAPLSNLVRQAAKPFRTGIIIAIAGASIFYVWPMISKIRK